MRRRRKRLISRVSEILCAGPISPFVPLFWLTCPGFRPPDLKAQYEVKLEESLDTFIVIDGLPIVPEESRPKLVKFLLRKLNAVGHTSEDAVFMPINDKKMSEGYVFWNEHEHHGLRMKTNACFCA